LIFWRVTTTAELSAGWGWKQMEQNQPKLALGQVDLVLGNQQLSVQQRRAAERARVECLKAIR